MAHCKKIQLLVLFLLLCIPAELPGRERGMGLPFIVNYPRSIYNASTQNWSITQDRNGFMYFGNNDGVLQFDGTGWNIFPVPNGSVVRAVYAKGDTIYAGAFEEIGFFAPNSQGRLSWHSLNYLVPEAYASFDEVWNIFPLPDGVIFQSFNFIFIVRNDTFTVLEPTSNFSFMHEAGGHFFVVDTGEGLMKLENDKLKRISTNPVFFRNEVTCVIPFGQGSFILGTTNEGLFRLDENRLSAWNTDVNPHLQNHNLFSGIRLSDGNLAFGTISNGVYITNNRGSVIQHVNRSKGLQNNTALALFEDRRNNLWAGLDNGIDYVEISSPLTTLDFNYNIETVYSSIVHDGILYVGTNQGLYAAPYARMGEFSFSDTGFRLIKGTEGQVWNLEVIDNTLFCGHNFGLFHISEFTARQISDIRGFWSFIQPQGHDDLILAGTYSGILRLRKTQGRWNVEEELQGFRESSRNIYLDDNFNLWVSHGYRGLFRLETDPEFREVRRLSFFFNESGLPPQLPYNIHSVNNRMIITTREGILQFDYARQEFVEIQSLNNLFAGKGFIDKIYQSHTGDLWYFTDNYVGVMRLLEDGSYRDIMAPFSGINEYLIPAFQNIFITQESQVFLGTQNGLVHYNPAVINDYTKVEGVFLSDITFYSHSQSSALTLYQHPEDPGFEAQSPELPFALNSVTFRYTSPAYENPDRLRFSYRLSGLDESWSAWDAINFKEYTNLREGNYVFELKARNAFGMESEVLSFPFTIKPPFLRSRAAFVIYGLLFLVIVAGNVYFIRRRMLKIRLKEKIRHEKRLARREQMFQEKSALSEKEIMHLRNESLRNEMSHKNKELANATLHLIQKNRTLTDMKSELNKMLKSSPANSPDRHMVNNLLKKVNKDLRNEKQWELFNDYFDEVHQDFIARLKNEYDDLTPKELRLCAYLRMNISSKEIAPLMNISVRGVEISRYRLRKKLKLGHDTNLTEFIMTF